MFLVAPGPPGAAAVATIWLGKEWQGVRVGICHVVSRLASRPPRLPNQSDLWGAVKWGDAVPPPPGRQSFLAQKTPPQPQVKPGFSLFTLRQWKTPPLVISTRIARFLRYAAPVLFFVLIRIPIKRNVGWPPKCFVNSAQMRWHVSRVQRYFLIFLAVSVLKALWATPGGRTAEVLSK